MTIEEAKKIFVGWQEFVEIDDKLSKVFWSHIPESLLPYKKYLIEEALNIIAEDYFSAGDNEASRNVQGSMLNLMRYKNDEEAIQDILNLEYLKNDDLRKVCIENLRKSFDSWEKSKQ